MTPDVFCENFSHEDLQEAISHHELGEDLKSELKCCLAAQKRLSVINKRNQYITEKLSNEIETILNFTNLTTKDIQIFRSKIQQLRCMLVQDLDEC